ncbi:pre-mrna-splicing factor 38b [Fusarium subglutinans]|uniref:Pre-mrna-splicing factor 38b n=1 Tax=Gibberella subglutinans TaxID=42677 RepID=A0A8H5UXP2_GIBSU|nr:pre-mrna-splicing factor 38b [Fusarium subglutinans]KAF5601265.1 pre-mrna-splicing factor 38b [Fusarium subglutinans]
MSNNDDLLTDDYVADLLSQEASDCSLKYSAMGMEAYRTNKKPASMMKPNTRFLRHIIKDTDNHNKALLAKEAAESKARLKDLERTEEIKRSKTNPSVHDIRRRQMGDIHAILGGKKRPRDEDEAGPSSRRDSRRAGKDRRQERKHDQRSDDLFTDKHSDQRQHGRLSRDDRRSKTDDESRRSDRSRRDHRQRDRTRSRDRDSEEGGHHRRSQKRRDRSRSPASRRRSRSPRESKSKHRHRSPRDKSEDRKRKEEEEEGSDAMEDLIGPAPPPKYRGRGTVGGSSGIDRRFSDTYDPKTDIQMDEDEVGNDWDDAVEAFRDRQKLRQTQEQRLKDAGFVDEQIQRASGADEKSAENVQWSKAGEKRAWDVGKVIGSDGVAQPEI